MELINSKNEPIKTLAAAKAYCRAKGLDTEKIKLNETTGIYFLEDKKEIGKEEVKTTSAQRKKLSIEDILKRAEDEGYEVPTLEEVEEVIEDGVKHSEAMKKERSTLEEKGFDPFDAQQNMDFLKRIEKQDKVLMTITPIINSIKNCIEDKTRQLEIDGRPQVDINNRPITVAYVEASVNGFTFTYNITDHQRRVVPFMAPLDVAKILADAYYPKQCSGFLMPNGTYYTPHQVGGNSLPIYASEAEFKQIFTPNAGQRLVQNR
jgi:hypothetical protein